VDEQRAAEICSYTEVPPVNLVGRTNFKQLTCILQQARLCLGGDTGPVHLASGLGTPTIMVMGPTDANRNGPYGQLENALEADRPCRYCWQRACPKNLDCLEAITPRQVLEKIETLL
jgi:heptosyltransferase-1